MPSYPYFLRPLPSVPRAGTAAFRNSPAARRSRPQCLGQIPGVQYRVAYFDVAEALTGLAPGQEPDADAVAQLQAISASGTSFAPVACTALRYFLPEWTCGEGKVGGFTQARAGATGPNTATPARATVQVTAFPNPAHESARVEIRAVGKGAAVPATAVFELVQVATGRVVASQPVTGETLTLSLSSVPSGVYVGRLVADQRPLATCKLVVIH